MSIKVKKITGLVLLLLVLIVIKLFLGGPYLDHFWKELIIEILVLLVISFILMIVPLIFKLVNKKRIEYKKGRKICFFNSLILFSIFAIPNLITILKGINNNYVSSIDPVVFSKSLIEIYFIVAIFYYFINMCFFVDNKK